MNTQQARIEDITLKEDFGTFVATQEDDFGDMGSFGMDMDTFMISDLERGRQLGVDSLVGDNESGLDFYNQSNFASDSKKVTKSSFKWPVSLFVCILSFKR